MWIVRGPHALLAIDNVVAQLGGKSRTDLRCLAAEVDHHPIVSYPVNTQPPREEPPRDRINIVLRSAESLAELDGREPVMVVRRRGILQLLKKFLQCFRSEEHTSELQSLRHL